MGLILLLAMVSPTQAPQVQAKNHEPTQKQVQKDTVARRAPIRRAVNPFRACRSGSCG